MGTRSLRFMMVGALGSLVQFGVFALLSKAAGMHYLLATILAVEALLAHNFLWHERWTWGTHGQPGVWTRALRFQAGTGTIALLSNLFAMRLLVGTLGVAPWVASPLAIGTSGAVNFLLGEFVIFKRTSGQPSSR